MSQEPEYPEQTPSGRQTSEVLVHMIEEYARHNGRADCCASASTGGSGSRQLMPPGLHPAHDKAPCASSGALSFRRRMRDLNPRGVSSPTRFPIVRTRPLCESSNGGGYRTVGRLLKSVRMGSSAARRGLGRRGIGTTIGTFGTFWAWSPELAALCIPVCESLFRGRSPRGRPSQAPGVRAHGYSGGWS